VLELGKKASMAMGWLPLRKVLVVFETSGWEKKDEREPSRDISDCLLIIGDWLMKTKCDVNSQKRADFRCKASRVDRS